MASVQGDFEVHVNNEVVPCALVLEEAAHIISMYSLLYKYCQPLINKSGLIL